MIDRYRDRPTDRLIARQVDSEVRKVDGQINR